MSSPNPVFASPSGAGDDGKAWRYKDSTGVGELFDPASQAELDAHVNDPSGAHAATAISFTPTGTISSTTVQAAIAEVASEAAGGSGGDPPLGGDLLGTASNAQIAPGVVMNADINSSAAIALSKLATDPVARANHTGTQAASTINDFNTAVRTNRLDQMAAPTAAVAMGSQRLTSVADPSGSTDATNKSYVDSVATGLDPKQSVRAATTANITLSGAQTIDGVAVVATNRVLVKNQSTGSANGIYTAAAGAWARAVDADTDIEVTPGMFTFVEEGTAQAGTGWVLATPAPITLGTTSLLFTQFSGGGANPNMGGDLTGTASNAQIAANAVGTTEIVNGAVTVPKLSATGSPGSTTFLRGDGTWNVPAGGGGGSVTDVQTAFNAVDHGADPTGAAYSDTAIQSIMTTIETYTPTYPYNYRPKGAKIYFPRGTYKFAQPIHVRRPITIEGEGGQHFENATTLLRFDAGVAGVIFEHRGADNTEGDSSGSILTRVSIESAQTETLWYTTVDFLDPIPAPGDGTHTVPWASWPVPDGVTHGVWIKSAFVVLQDVGISKFAGNGVHIEGSAGFDNKNPNCWKLDRCSIATIGGHGVYTNGADVNAGQCTNLSVVETGGYGIYESSWLGNYYAGGHFRFNYPGAVFAEGFSNESVFIGFYCEQQVNQPILDANTGSIQCYGYWYPENGGNIHVTNQGMWVAAGAANARVSVRSNNVDVGRVEAVTGGGIRMIASDGAPIVKATATKVAIESSDTTNTALEVSHQHPSATGKIIDVRTSGAGSQWSVDPAGVVNAKTEVIATGTAAANLLTIRTDSVTPTGKFIDCKDINNTTKLSVSAAGNLATVGDVGARTVQTATGATGARPTGLAAGSMWYDTTLGKPIWYTGSVWKDATGATV